MRRCHIKWSFIALCRPRPVRCLTVMRASAHVSISLGGSQGDAARVAEALEDVDSLTTNDEGFTVLHTATLYQQIPVSQLTAPANDFPLRLGTRPSHGVCVAGTLVTIFAPCHTDPAADYGARIRPLYAHDGASLHSPAALYVSRCRNSHAPCSPPFLRRTGSRHCTLLPCPVDCRLRNCSSLTERPWTPRMRRARGPGHSLARSALFTGLRLNPPCPPSGRTHPARDRRRLRLHRHGPPADHRRS